MHSSFAYNTSILGSDGRYCDISIKYINITMKHLSVNCGFVLHRNQMTFGVLQDYESHLEIVMVLLQISEA